jgi:hypothetical protein
MTRVIALAAALLLVAGCGGEKPQASKPERAAAMDWRPSAERACGDVTSTLLARGWFMDLKEMRRRLPSTARDVRAAIERTERLPGRRDQRFVADMGALDQPLAELARAARAMDVDRLDRVITNLEGKASALAGSARRAGLKDCVGKPRRITNALRAPVAAEQVARIIRWANRREHAAVQDKSINGLRAGVEVREDMQAAVNNLHVPTWAERQHARWLAAAQHYARGIDELGDRFEAGLGTPEAQYDEMITRRFRQTNRRLHELYDAIGAHSLGD